MTDESLMAAYVEGDVRAFETLFARVAPRLHGFFLRSLRDSSAADDLLQVTWMKVHRARATWQPDRPLLPWLFQVAARVRLDELRRRKRLPEDADEEALAKADEAEAARSAQDSAGDEARTNTQEAVRAALERLPENQRVVIHLHRSEGLTLGQIAQVLGTTEGAVKLRAFRGYERLRQDLRCLMKHEEAA